MAEPGGQGSGAGGEAGAGVPGSPATPGSGRVPGSPGRPGSAGPSGSSVSGLFGSPLPGSVGGRGGSSAARIAGESTPPVRLPLASETGATQAEHTLDPPALTDDLDEEDLFGSEGEDAPGTRLSAAAPVSATAKPAQDAEDMDEKDLFGDVDDDIDEKELFGSDDEGDIDEKDLFGSDNEAGATIEPAAAAKAVPEPAEPSELDEREIFGDVSDDDEPDKVEDVDIRRRPAPSEDRAFKSLRLPNVLTIEKTPFDPNNIPQSHLEGYKEFKNTQDLNVVKLLNPENCVRWRFKKGADGQNLMDEDGRPQYESNARIVEWEDGSRTLYVGNEVFNMSEISSKAVLFEENSNEVHVCHGAVQGRLVATPRNLQSGSHEYLKRTQFRKYQPVRRSLLLTPDSEVSEKQFYELEMEQKKKQEKKRIAEGGQEITAAFLEEDQPDAAAGPSVLAVKKQFKAVKRQKTQ